MISSKLTGTISYVVNANVSVEQSQPRRSNRRSDIDALRRGLRIRRPRMFLAENRYPRKLERWASGNEAALACPLSPEPHIPTSSGNIQRRGGSIRFACLFY
ncbi:hypothetical protein CC1G_12359 [Coprinopsis cinerea okayama7|uniref:Uncharacterized protein n=1 Tax=Coprinopsis cinerea (strain Okayama-7 / 130 / ATCC MYA-4618 / FGSC 9003) TaxID=240176 RepID=A8P566_COPC7|nr:hypothetical protein CC1G_12359 [Coprinopsis cinerea okayama7\|eukprot:XP_001838885.2 hypothetical protein CC1G_12359 [Coprinopsis cinerea okayama7\